MEKKEKLRREMDNKTATSPSKDSTSLTPEPKLGAVFPERWAEACPEL